MTFQTLDYIIAIAEEKSISKAADRLLLSAACAEPTVETS